MRNLSLILIVGFSLCGTAPTETLVPTAKAEEIQLFKQKITSHLLINLFLEKVDQGDLVIFEHPLNRSDLQSHNVSYIHNINDDTLSVNLSFKLKNKIPLPKISGYYVDEITVGIDKHGNIVDIKSHVYHVDKKEH